LHPFAVTHSAVRVVFGAGASAGLAQELGRLDLSRPLFVCSERARPDVDRLAADLEPGQRHFFTGARQHVPEADVAAAVQAAERANADCVVCYGGGSAIGFGKAIALRRAVAVVAIPTTYSGSEMTPIWGITGAAGKRTGRDERVRPRLVLYDPALGRELPLATAIPSLFNAMAHAVEALYADAVDPITALMAEEAIRALAASAPRLAADPRDADARERALYGAYLAGAALGTVGMALHHKLCHVLGGSFGMPHAETHTVVLPHVIRYNQPAAPEAIARVARAIDADDAAAGLYDLQARVGAPTSLRELGLAEADLDRAAELAVQSAYYNPRELDAGEIRALLQDAFLGKRPERIQVTVDSPATRAAARSSRKVVATPADAIAGLTDGARVMVGGFGLSNNPEALIRAVVDAGVRDLTLISNNAGNLGKGLAAWLRAGIVRRVVCTYLGNNDDLHRLAASGALQIEVVPQGTFAERIRAGGAGIPAFFTPTGVDTVMAEGKEERAFDGRRALLEQALRADFALIRAQRADPFGNLRFRRTGRNFAPLMAMAAETAIAEVDELVPLGGIDPDDVHLPGLFVDRIVEVREHDDPFEYRTVR